MRSDDSPVPSFAVQPGLIPENIFKLPFGILTYTSIAATCWAIIFLIEKNSSQEAMLQN